MYEMIHKLEWQGLTPKQISKKTGLKIGHIKSILR